MFNFFKYKNNKPIPFRNLRYKDIQKFLKDDWEEGYTIEFKEFFNDDVKKKIPAIFTSFANCEGGLLLIGIKDKTRCISDINKPKGEIYAILSQLIENKISPISPKFNAKFIENPKKKGTGIIVAYVEEGLIPPYIANGTIYVREANRKVPIRPERPTVDYLYKKREQSSNIILMDYNNQKLTQTLKSNKFAYYTDGLEEFNQLKITIEKLVEKIKNYDLSSFKVKEKAKSENELFSTLAIVSGSTTLANDFFKDKFNQCKEYLKYLGISYDDKFFDLEKLYIKNMITSSWDYFTEDERSKKCEDLRKLANILNTYIFSLIALNNFVNCYEYNFVINNLGGKFDEDISLIIKFPRNSIVNIADSTLFNKESTKVNNKIISYITNNPAAEIESFDNYHSKPFTAQPPMKGIPLGFDYEDKEYLFEKFINDLENIYQYEFYQTEAFDIIKVKFNKILPRQKMYLPSKIITNKDIKQISYEIISKYSAYTSIGELVLN